MGTVPIRCTILIKKKHGRPRSLGNPFLDKSALKNHSNQILSTYKQNYMRQASSVYIQPLFQLKYNINLLIHIM